MVPLVILERGIRDETRESYKAVSAILFYKLGLGLRSNTKDARLCFHRVTPFWTQIQCVVWMMAKTQIFGHDKRLIFVSMVANLLSI